MICSNQFEVLRTAAKRKRTPSPSIDDEKESASIDEISVPEELPITPPHPQLSTFIYSKNIINKYPFAQLQKTHIISTEDGKCYIGLRENEAWCFIGLCRVRVVKGYSHFYGHLMGYGDQVPVECYSPSTHAPVTFESEPTPEFQLNPNGEPIEIYSGFLEKEVKSKLMEFEASLTGNADDLPGFSCILELSSLYGEKSVDKFEKTPFYGSIFKPHRNAEYHELLAGLYHVCYANTLAESYIMPQLYCPLPWHAFVNEKLVSCIGSNSPPKIAVCGSKAVGKSTFTKFLINKLLKEYGKVCYLDTDVGQPEFTPSGLLSLNEITAPVVGPCFTHIDIQESRFYGYLMPDRNPNLYYEQLIELYRVYLTKYRTDNVPLIINTHGWIKSIGLDLIHQILQLTRPGFIVQFIPHQNDGSLRFSDVVANNDALKTNIINEWPTISKSSNNYTEQLISKYDLDTWNFESILFPPPLLELGVKHLQCKWTAADNRNLRMLFYFASQIGKNSWDFTHITDMVPKFIGFDDVSIVGDYSEMTMDAVLKAMNASVVGLISKSSVAGDHRCIGLGIVRAVTPENSIKHGMYIITPLTHEYLNTQNITILHRHSESIPISMLFQDKKQIKSSPYCESFVIDGIQGHRIRKTRRDLLRKYHDPEFQHQQHQE